MGSRAQDTLLNGQSGLSFLEEGSKSHGKATILLIHGALSSGHEWSQVIPYLRNRYHVLNTDLPAHGRSMNVGNFSKELAARLLANLVRNRGADSKAHVVGHSLGASIAIELACHYPEVVDKVFVSGYGGAFSNPQLLAHGLWLQGAVESAIPSPVIRWLMDGIEFPSSSPTPNSLGLCKDIARSMCHGEAGWPQPWNASTLIIAAGKSGILPTSDNPEAAKRLRDIGRKANDTTVAYTHPDMRHPWDLQAPELYARTVSQWFEQGTVPDGFKLL